MNEPREDRTELSLDDLSLDAPGVASNASDVRAQEPTRVFILDHYTAILAKNPPSMLARSGVRSSIRFLWALAVVDGGADPSDPDSLLFIVAPEETLPGNPVLCAFSDNG